MKSVVKEELCNTLNRSVAVLQDGSCHLVIV